MGNADGYQPSQIYDGTAKKWLSKLQKFPPANTTILKSAIRIYQDPFLYTEIEAR